MKATWILVAESSRARIFTADTPSAALREIETLAHPEGRQHEQQMTSDLPGKDPGVNGAGGHAYTTKVEPKQHEEISFARRIAQHLDDARKKNDYQQLLIVSAPSFLGVLRHELNSATAKLVCFELNKNLVTQSPEDIRRHLPEFLPGID